MRRLVVLIGSLFLVATGSVASGQTTKAPMSFKVRLIQEQTHRHPNPPAGDAGDVFSTTLRLFAVGPLFGFPDRAYVGSMSFSYTLSGACSSSGAGCKGTSDLNTLTKLPGGTITADGKNVSLGHLPYVVPIQKGTGTFAGATGTISIASGAIASGNAENVYNIKFS